MQSMPAGNTTHWTFLNHECGTVGTQDDAPQPRTQGSVPLSRSHESHSSAHPTGGGGSPLARQPDPPPGPPSPASFGEVAAGAQGAVLLLAKAAC